MLRIADGWLDLSVDLRDALGDRLYLSQGLRRDGVSLSYACECLHGDKNGGLSSRTLTSVKQRGSSTPDQM